jgi:ribosomal-protein-alanine N-acetyltransferase
MTENLETERLRLRPFEMADLPDFAPIYGDEAVMAIRKIGVQTSSQSETELAGIIQHWRDHGFGLWAVIHKADNRLLGECGLRHSDYGQEIEISYGLSKQAWGKGFATEAAFAVLDDGFGVAGLEDIVAIARACNHASHRVMQKLGMYLKKTWESDGVELVHYSVTREDYLRNQAARKTTT